MTSTLSTVSNIVGCVSFVFDFCAYFDGGASDPQSESEFSGELHSLEKVLRNLADRKPGACQSVDPTEDILRTENILRTEVTKFIGEIDKFREKMGPERGRLRRLFRKALQKKNTLEFSEKVERRKSFFTLTLMIVIMERLNQQDIKKTQSSRNIEHPPPNVLTTDLDPYKPAVPQTAPEEKLERAKKYIEEETYRSLSRCRLLQKSRGVWMQNGKLKKQYSSRSYPYPSDTYELRRDPVLCTRTKPKLRNALPSELLTIRAS